MLGVCTSLCISFYNVDGLTRYPVILLLMSWPTGIYFQVLSTEDRLAYGYYGLIREFGWRKIGLIVQDENVFRLVSLYLNLLSYLTMVP